MDKQQRPLSERTLSLFAAIYEQTQNVLGQTCGFYVAMADAERDVVRLVYHVDGGEAREVRARFPTYSCDAIRDARPVINDGFSRLVSVDVLNSISVPMIRNSVVLGAFGVYTCEQRTYAERDAKALVAIAEVGALALENERFVMAIEKARIEAERLEEIGRAISASLELPQVLRCVVDAALQLIESDSATVWLLKNEGEIEVAMTVGETAPPLGLTMPVPPALRHRMADLRRPYFVYEDVKDGTHELPLGMRNLTGVRSTMAVALIAEDKILGALSVGHKERVKYTAGEIRMLERLSYHAAIAVANARLHEQIMALSLTDALTALPNRRHLDMCLQKEFAAAKRGRKLSVMLFDLDHFKAYNDRAGHQAGDAVLKAFAAVLAAQTRAMNMAARYGGDEFITILADTDRAGALAHADRIINATENDPHLAAAGVRACVGIASYDVEMDSFEELIRAADMDLYVNKVARKEATA